tara:strand:- start:65 stop:544 length:480 start_codon:yes stop_codon:yes gene_type:complete
MRFKQLFLFVALFICTTFIISQNNYRTGQINNSYLLTGEDYIAGEDGVPRMNINVWGHVKHPGSYLVYDGIDILTCLSMGGGPLKGANMKNILITSKDGKTKKINLDDFINDKKIDTIVLKPYDTIYVNENLSSYLLSRTGVITVLLQLTNLILISTNN